MGTAGGRSRAGRILAEPFAVRSLALGVAQRRRGRARRRVLDADSSTKVRQ